MDEREGDVGKLFARIVWGENGQGIRSVIDGRHRNATAVFTSVKAGFTSQPVESAGSELTVIQIAEASSAIHAITSQPHRLEMRLGEKGRELIYFPDFMFIADLRLVSDLRRKARFEEAALAWRPTAGHHGTTRLIVEVKGRHDRRLLKPDYMEKLKLAKLVYRAKGMAFAVITEDTDFERVPSSAVQDICYYRDAHLRVRDIAAATRSLAAAGGVMTYAALCEALGGSPQGNARVAALHARRIVSVDVSGPLAPHTPVVAVRGKD